MTVSRERLEGVRVDETDINPGEYPSLREPGRERLLAGSAGRRPGDGDQRGGFCHPPALQNLDRDLVVEPLEQGARDGRPSDDDSFQRGQIVAGLAAQELEDVIPDRRYAVG